MPFLYLVGTAPLLCLTLLPLKSVGSLTAVGAGFDSLCKTTGFLMEIEICSISLNEQKHLLYLEGLIYIFHWFSITSKRYSVTTSRNTVVHRISICLMPYSWCRQLLVETQKLSRWSLTILSRHLVLVHCQQHKHVHFVSFTMWAKKCLRIWTWLPLKELMAKGSPLHAQGLWCPWYARAIPFSMQWPSCSQ